MDDTATTDSTMTGPSSYRSPMHYLALSSVTIVTLACLCFIKYSLSAWLRQGGSRRATCPEMAASKSNRFVLFELPWLYGDLCCDTLIFITLACMSLYSLHFTSLLKKPFTGEEAFHSCEIPLCVALGILSYRLIRLLLGSEIKPRFRTRHMYIGIAIVTYISILVTSENTIVGVVGMFCQMPILFHTAEKITLELHIANTYNGRSPRRCASGIHAVSVVIFSLILPLVYLTLAVKANSPFKMTYYSVGLFSFVSVLFFIIHVWNLAVVMRTTCQDDRTSLDTEYCRLMQDHSDKGVIQRELLAQTKGKTDENKHRYSDTPYPFIN